MVLKVGTNLALNHWSVICPRNDSQAFHYPSTCDRRGWMEAKRKGSTHGDILLCVWHRVPVAWTDVAFHSVLARTQPTEHLERVDVLYEVLIAPRLQAWRDANSLYIESLLFALSCFHLGRQTSTLPAACRRVELGLGGWRSEPLAFVGVRCTKAGALSNKLSRPFRHNQRYGNGGVRVRAWQTVASDGQVFSLLFTRLRVTKRAGQLARGLPPIMRRRLERTQAEPVRSHSATVWCHLIRRIKGSNSPPIPVLGSVSSRGGCFTWIFLSLTTFYFYCSFLTLEKHGHSFCVWKLFKRYKFFLK